MPPYAAAGQPGKITLSTAILVVVTLGILLFLLILALHVPNGDTRPHAMMTLMGKLAAGLENFRGDWGVYPPSTPEPGEGRQYGYQNLVYYLTGPTGQGWGAAIGGLTPLGGQAPGRTYSPYYTIEPSDRLLEGAGLAVSDLFRSPRRPILYFRYDADRDPPCDVRDNPVDPTCEKGFASQAHFELSITYETPEGRRKWQRDDYLLISPGADRLYGYVIEDEATDTMRPATSAEEVRSGQATCDDIANF